MWLTVLQLAEGSQGPEAPVFCSSLFLGDLTVAGPACPVR